MTNGKKRESNQTEVSLEFVDRSKYDRVMDRWKQNVIEILHRSDLSTPPTVSKTVLEKKKSSENIAPNLKLTMTIREASEYSNIGINKMESMLRTPNCPFVLFVGTKKLVKRKEFEDFISKSLVI